jgi:hypothetical protein
MYHLRQYVEAGGLISYSADLNEIWRRAAVFVDKILRGAKPADLPVEQPSKFELVINLKAALLGVMRGPTLTDQPAANTSAAARLPDWRAPLKLPYCVVAVSRPAQ